MSTCPGTTLEDFLAWQYGIVITDGNAERNPNLSLRYAEAFGNATPLPRVSSEQLSLITQHYEPYREYIEDKLLDFDEEEHGSWRGYAEVVDSIVPADVQELADSEVKKINEINHLRAELEQSEAALFRVGVRRVTACLGCGKPVDDDCGCPAGTVEQLVNKRAEQAEARVRELESYIHGIRSVEFDFTAPEVAKRRIRELTDLALANSEKGGGS